MSILDDIDKVTAGLCPCGADPAPGSAYCSDDCRPTHVGEHTDTRMSGNLATAARWRPDLVTAADDTNLIPLDVEPYGYTGRFNAQLFERRDRDCWHLRLDDGHRFVGVDLDNNVEDETAEQFNVRCGKAWRRLKRELADPRHAVVPDSYPALGWAELGWTVGEWMNSPPRPEVRWERRCRSCNQYGAPTVGHRFTGQHVGWDSAGPLTMGEAFEECQICPHCRQPHPGPPLTLSVERDAPFGCVRIQLSGVVNGRRYQQTGVVSDQLARATVSTDHLFRATLDRMEERILHVLAAATDAPVSRGAADRRRMVYDGYRWIDDGGPPIAPGEPFAARAEAQVRELRVENR